jgi:outer membrane protein assembly factor BamB
VAGNLVYVEDPFSELLAFPIKCGVGGAACQPLWIDFAGQEGRVAAAGGIIYSAGRGKLYAFTATCAANHCRPLFTSTQLGADTTSSPTVAGGQVYVSTTDGNLLALDLP